MVFFTEKKGADNFSELYYRSYFRNDTPDDDVKNIMLHCNVNSIIIMIKIMMMIMVIMITMTIMMIMVIAK